MIDPTENKSPDPLPRRRFRWRLIPATFMYLLGPISVLKSVVMLLGSLYVNLRYGWIAPGSDNPARNAVALTTANLTLWQLYFWIGVMAIFSAISWQKGHWRWAWISTGLVWLLMGLFGFLTPKI